MLIGIDKLSVVFCVDMDLPVPVEITGEDTAFSGLPSKEVMLKQKTIVLEEDETTDLSCLTSKIYGLVNLFILDVRDNHLTG
jgi:hypothetical protein